MSESTNNLAAIERLAYNQEFSVPHQGRYKFRGIRHEKSGDVVVTGVGGKHGHSEFRSFKAAGPTRQRPARIRTHRVQKLRAQQ